MYNALYSSYGKRVSINIFLKPKCFYLINPPLKVIYFLNIYEKLLVIFDVFFIVNLLFEMVFIQTSWSYFFVL